MRYYRLLEDMSLPHRVLGAPRTPSGAETRLGQFVMGDRYRDAEPVSVPVFRDGPRLTATFGLQQMFLLPTRIAEQLADIAAGDVQLVRATIEGDPGDWRIVNAVTNRDCLDEARSTIDWASDADQFPGAPPVRYRYVARIQLDPTGVDGAEVFRLAHWRVALIVSERVRDFFVHAKAGGARFQVVEAGAPHPHPAPATTRG